MIECCDNCRFLYIQVDNKKQCRRRAPLPYNAMIFHLSELVRDIAWNTRVGAEMDTPAEGVIDDLNTEATEATDYAVWPEVEKDDWCGEWSDRGEAPTRRWQSISSEETAETRHPENET